MSSEQVKRGRGRPRQTLSIEKPPTIALSSRAIRDIMALARDTKIEVAQVVEDVVTNGLIQTRGMYSEVVKARKDLEKLRNEYRRKVQDDGRVEETDNNGINERSGTSADEFDQGLRPEPGHAVFEPGQPQVDAPDFENPRESFDLVNDTLPPF